jgi:hypothetical protein
MRRFVVSILVVIAIGGLLLWRYQSELIGIGARWYLGRVALREHAEGQLGQRRAAIARMHRMLLIAPPTDASVPELFDVLTALSARVATGAIDLPWAAYVYTSHWRDLMRDRPTGSPRYTLTQVEALVEEQVRFYSIQKRPDVPGFGLRNFIGNGPGESYTVEEIEAAAREGRDLGRVK